MYPYMDILLLLFIYAFQNGHVLGSSVHAEWEIRVCERTMICALERSQSQDGAMTLLLVPYERAAARAQLLRLLDGAFVCASYQATR